jgi:hypothetical protein
MQFGSLTSAQQTSFIAKQAAQIRKPTFDVWIAGVGSITTPMYFQIDVESGLESPLGRGNIQIGRALLTASNEDLQFWNAAGATFDRGARIKIWAGFDDLNIPIFTGVVYDVHPVVSGDYVVVSCTDYMGLLRKMIVEGSQDPNNTPKLLAASWCDDIQASSAVQTTDETTAVYTQPGFEKQRALRALEEVCDSIFHVAYFDVDGALVVHEREYSNAVDWTFDDDNTLPGTEKLADTEIINSVVMEYRENFFAMSRDQDSIDSYGLRQEEMRTPITNSILVAEKATGSTDETLNNDLEAIKFTSASDAAVIDCIHVKLRKDAAHGYITAKIYSDSGGSPNALLATSQLKASDNLKTWFVWEVFYFADPLSIAASTDYWIVIDTTSVSSGTVYLAISTSTATGKHAYYSGSWSTENDKWGLHRVRGSVEAQRVVSDIVRFHKDPKERQKVVAPAVPQLELMDSVVVDISSPPIRGHYVIENRRHVLRPGSYETMDKMRKVG